MKYLITGGGFALEPFSVPLDPAAAELYRKIAASAGVPVEKVLADALYKLAGSLSLEAMAKRKEK